jgi:type IV pilus assembly protein PilV
MNGGWLPMLGSHGTVRAPENARVNTSLAPMVSSAPRRSRSAGFTLIEVLIALIVLVLGVLGAAGMTLASIRDSKQSGLRSQASAFAYELSDLMRANPGQETVFTSAASAASTSCWTTGCSPTDMAKNDYYEWSTKLTGPNGLPNAQAVVCYDRTDLNQFACDNDVTAPLVVKLQWDEKNNNARGQAATSGATVTTRLMSVVIKTSVQ